MKINLDFAAGVGYICFMVGMAWAAVGTMPEQPAEPFGWNIPLLMLLVTAVPFVAGFLAGRNSRPTGDEEKE